jgi:hypothetical protein
MWAGMVKIFNIAKGNRKKILSEQERKFLDERLAFLLKFSSLYLASYWLLVLDIAFMGLFITFCRVNVLTPIISKE